MMSQPAVCSGAPFRAIASIRPGTAFASPALPRTSTICESSVSCWRSIARTPRDSHVVSDSSGRNLQAHIGDHCQRRVESGAARRDRRSVSGELRQWSPVLLAVLRDRDGRFPKPVVARPATCKGGNPRLRNVPLRVLLVYRRPTQVAAPSGVGRRLYSGRPSAGRSRRCARPRRSRGLDAAHVHLAAAATRTATSTGRALGRSSYCGQMTDDDDRVPLPLHTSNPA